MKKLQTLVLLVTVLFTSCSIENSKTSDKNIDKYLEDVIKVHKIPGLAIGIMKDGEVLFEAYKGLANIEHSVPVTSENLFRIYSSTKLVVATTIFKLIEEKKINLEDNLLSYIDGNKKDWGKIKIKHLLAHSSGLPNFIRYDSSLENDEMFSIVSNASQEFEPGDKFSYNQTNYWFLAKIIEKVSGQTFEDFVIETQFKGNDEGIVFSSNSTEVISNRVSKYNFDYSSDKFQISTDKEKSRGFAGNGLNVTLTRLIEWTKGFDNDKIINNETKQQMWAHYNYKSNDKFLYGWGDYSENGVVSYGFTGGGVSAIRKYPSKNMTIILLTNGYKYSPVHNSMVNTIAGIVDPTLKNEAQIIEFQLQKDFINKNIDVASVSLSEVINRNSDINFEPILNRLGYLLMKIDIEKAISVFKKNTELYPMSINTFDSLGEAYFVNKDLKNSKKYYEKVLSIDKNNKNAIYMLNKINEILENKK